MSAPSDRAIIIRGIDSFAEIDACVELQRSVWQFPDLDIVPRRMFVVARAVGGQILGAWDGNELAGYALAVPGTRDGLTYLHSHMLAVAPAYRDCGVGKRLKLAQREDALLRGIERIEWTFDPMQTKNAYFNLEKLGAVARRYSADFYGPSTSPAHGSLPTDRLHAEWWLQSPRVQALLAGKLLPADAIKETITVTKWPSDLSATLLPSAASALEALLTVRGKFQTAFSSGLIALRFQIDDVGEAAYRLGIQQ